MNICYQIVNKLNLFSLSHLTISKFSGISFTKQKIIIVAQVVFGGLAACFSYLSYKKWRSKAQKLEVAPIVQTSSMIESTPEKGTHLELPKTAPKPSEKISTPHKKVEAAKLQLGVSQIASTDNSELEMTKKHLKEAQAANAQALKDVQHYKQLLHFEVGQAKKTEKIESETTQTAPSDNLELEKTKECLKDHQNKLKQALENVHHYHVLWKAEIDNFSASDLQCNQLKKDNNDLQSQINEIGTLKKENAKLQKEFEKLKKELQELHGKSQYDLSAMAIDCKQKETFYSSKAKSALNEVEIWKAKSKTFEADLEEAKTKIQSQQKELTAAENSKQSQFTQLTAQYLSKAQALDLLKKQILDEAQKKPGSISPPVIDKVINRIILEGHESALATIIFPDEFADWWKKVKDQDPFSQIVYDILNDSVYRFRVRLNFLNEGLTIATVLKNAGFDYKTPLDLVKQMGHQI